MRPGRAATRIVAVAVLVAASAGACGDDGPSPVEEIAVDLVSDPTFDGYDLTAGEARCMADDVVGELGDERIAGLRPARVDAEAATGASPTTALDYASLDDDELLVVADAALTCVADDGTSASDVVTTAVADGVRVSATDEFPVTDDEATCIGESVVASLGPTTMIAVGIRSAVDASADLDADESAAFVDAFLACTDVRARVLAGIGADPDNPISVDVIACLDANITDEQVDQLFALGFADAGGASDNQARADEVLAGAIATCA